MLKANREKAKVRQDEKIRGCFVFSFFRVFVMMFFRVGDIRCT